MKAFKTGMNRSGTAMAPRLTEQMLDAGELDITDAGEDESATILRMDYIEQSDPVGTIPPPASLKGVLSTLGNKLTGDNLAVLLDKMGERLAFERTGTRLYELMAIKARAEEETLPAGAVSLVEEICHDEQDHFDLLCDVIRDLGGDPTSMTPSADITGMQSMGLLAVAADPRIPFVQAVEVLRTAELVDNDGWDGLIQLAEHFGIERVEDLKAAKMQEEKHLESIRNLANEGLLQAAGATGTDSMRTAL